MARTRDNERTTKAHDEQDLAAGKSVVFRDVGVPQCAIRDYRQEVIPVNAGSTPGAPGRPRTRG
jgi:hypothetical protein